MAGALIAMSGGVDSSAAALLMQQQGIPCVGATMQLFSRADGCGSSQDAADAAQVCGQLGMEHLVLDLSELFRKKVMEPFAAAYEQGRTPNPCTLCNRHLKFGAMLEKMHALGLDLLVTGHYARVEYDCAADRYLLKKALDPSKDQTYVLYSLTQAQLRHVRMPLGGFTKPEIRRIAESRGLISARKKESQDICFVPDGDYAGFIRDFTGHDSLPGDFADTAGNVLGTHRGIIHYTIGQRRGLGIAAGHPLYVCGIDPEENRVILGEGEALYTDSLTAADVNLIAVPEMREPRRVLAKIRYRHREQPATAYIDGAGILHVQFDEPQRAVTPGQAVVLYDGDTVLGGGTIQY